MALAATKGLAHVPPWSPLHLLFIFGGDHDHPDSWAGADGNTELWENISASQGTHLLTLQIAILEQRNAKGKFKCEQFMRKYYEFFSHHIYKKHIPIYGRILEFSVPPPLLMVTVGSPTLLLDLYFGCSVYQ